MDIAKIPFYKIKIIFIFLWLFILIASFFCYIQKISVGQLTKNIFLARQKLPLLVMAQGENKPLPNQTGFTAGRQIMNNQNDFIFIGPYWPLLPGNYKVLWQIESDCVGHVGWADVVSRLEGSEYGKVEIEAQKANEIETITLPFQGDFSWNYEFRFVGQNKCEFKVLEAGLVRENIDWKAFFNQSIGKFK